ncbi:MAG: ABC transporter permease [Candidatus Omnitrophica bacterium]|nr:ABC transporter permease [Candidatus Omnitrophota bacterium]
MLTELWISQRYMRSRKKEKIISFTAFISIIGVAVGVAVLIIVISVMSGFDNYLQDKMLGTHAHLIIEFYPGYNQAYKLIEDLKRKPNIIALSPIIIGQAFIQQSNQIIGLDYRGIDPELTPRITKIKEYIKYGSLDLKNNEVLIGEELALRLGLGLADTITLISPVTLRPMEFKVKGIFNTGMYLYDSGLVMTNIKSAQDFFKMGDMVNAIGIKVDKLYQVEKIKKDLFDNLGNLGAYQIRTWMDINRNFLNALRLEKIVMFIVVAMTVVVAAFGIISTLMMAVMSKIRDIGILRSTGAKAKSILQIFVFQGLCIGIIGIILGVFSGVSLSLSLNKIIDFISHLIGRSLIPKDIYYFDRIPTHFSPWDITAIVIATLVISFLASIYPALYAVRINPSQAIRHE